MPFPKCGRCKGSNCRRFKSQILAWISRGKRKRSANIGILPMMSRNGSAESDNDIEECVNVSNSYSPPSKKLKINHRNDDGEILSDHTYFKNEDETPNCNGSWPMRFAPPSHGKRNKNGNGASCNGNSNANHSDDNILDTIEISDGSDVECVTDDIVPYPRDLPLKNIALTRPVLRINQQVLIVLQNWNPWKKAVISAMPYSGKLTPNSDIKCSFRSAGAELSKSVKPYMVAYFGCPNAVLKKVGTRVVAVFKMVDTPFLQKKSRFYSGSIGELPAPENDYKYLIFFDYNDRCEYVSHENIRLICWEAQPLTKFIPNPEMKKFMEKYLAVDSNRGKLIKLKANDNIIFFKDNVRKNGVVLECDKSLVHIKCQDESSSAWVYVGNPKLKLSNAKDITENEEKEESDRKNGMEREDETGSLLGNTEVAYVINLIEDSEDGDSPSIKKSMARKSTGKVAKCRESDHKLNVVPRGNVFTVESNLVSGGNPSPPPVRIGTARKSTGCGPRIIANGINQQRKTWTKIPPPAIMIRPELVNVYRPKKFEDHCCSPSCISWTNYTWERGFRIAPLARPMHFGFKRQILKHLREGVLHNSISYTGPCGRTFYDMPTLSIYLTITESQMTEDLFDFDYWVHCTRQFQIKIDDPLVKRYKRDFTNGKEGTPISVVNYVNDSMPLMQEYITARIPVGDVKIDPDPGFLCKCDCKMDCRMRSECTCSKLTKNSQIQMGPIDPNAGYVYGRLPDHVVTGVYECNQMCPCNKKLCPNSLTQNPMSQHLQLFMTEVKGWGVRCLNDIPKGSFICIYVGCLLSNQQANIEGRTVGDEYFAELDFMEVLDNTKEGYEKEVSSDTESSPRNSRQRLFGPGHNSIIVIDAKRRGNIGRYLNHSCNPNVFVQNVFVDSHDPRFPWIAFFAHTYIKAGEELTWNYNYVVDSVKQKGMYCYCGESNCRDRMF